jgi:hypothetical protein
MADKDTLNLLALFRCWPIVFVPRTHNSGGFFFANQVYWYDSTSLLSNLNNMISPNWNHRISIQQYYDNDVNLKRFFLEILQIAVEPTINDYLPWLTEVLNTDHIWRLIEVILRLAFQQNRQTEIKGNDNHALILVINIELHFYIETCSTLPFIPCMSTMNKKVKYVDRPFYPHDPDIADCLANTLTIIQLPGR